MLLLAERKRCAEILDGKGSAVLKEKITGLEVKVREAQAKEKEVKTRERMHKQRQEELAKEVKDTKAEMERRGLEQKKAHQEKVDRIGLELTDARLQVTELTRELKAFQDRYDRLREGME